MPTIKPTIKPPSPPDTPRALSRAAAIRKVRRLNQRMAAVAIWWVSMPGPKPPAFESADLSAHFRLPMQALAPAFRALGWTRIQRTDQGQARTLWLPPGSPVKPRKRGEASRLYAY